MSAVKRVVLALLLLAVLGGGGFGGWTWWREHDRLSRMATAQQLLDEGHLREAKGLAESIRTDYPNNVEGFLLSAWILRALHDRPGTSDVLQEAYDIAPRGFPMLPELVDHRLRGPDDPRKGYDALAFLDQHVATFPEDANTVAEGRLVALAYILGQPGLPAAQLLDARKQAEDALAAFHIEGAGTTTQHYDRAQTLLALGKFDASIAEGRAGIAAGTDRWQSLVMHWAITTSMMHHGDEEGSWNELNALEKSLADWPGTHFGMGKPLVELVELTARVRFGRPAPAPPDYPARLARLDEEGVRLQYGDEETRGLIGQLFTAMDGHDNPTALARVDDLLGIVARDRGCEMENQIIRPHTKAMLLTVRGDLQMGQRDFEAAQAAYEEALGLFPDDAWQAAKVETAKMASLGSDFTPANIPRSHAP